MSQHDSLRQRTEQHKPKNKKSKQNDKDVYESMDKVEKYLLAKPEFKSYLANDYKLVFEKTIKIAYMVEFIKRRNARVEFNYDFINREIEPDGGMLCLVKKSTGEKFPLVIAEIKRQGTNKERIQEGKKKQATGNAIERLGKNLTGIRTMMNYEKITPFVCFGSGCDFALDTPETGTVLSKVVMMNEFYDLNKIYVYKRDGNSDLNSYAPVSMFFREEEWSVDEMYNVMKEIAETSIRYYLY